MSYLYLKFVSSASFALSVKYLYPYPWCFKCLSPRKHFNIIYIIYENIRFYIPFFFFVIYLYIFLYEVFFFILIFYLEFIKFLQIILLCHEWIFNFMPFFFILKINSHIVSIEMTKKFCKRIHKLRTNLDSEFIYKWNSFKFICYAAFKEWHDWP